MKTKLDHLITRLKVSGVGGWMQQTVVLNVMRALAHKKHSTSL